MTLTFKVLTDADFLLYVDNKLFYSDIGGGAALFHQTDFDRYFSLLPKDRKEEKTNDDSWDGKVHHPVESRRHDYWSIDHRDCYVSPHTSLGMVRIGHGMTSKVPHIIYEPEGEELTILDYAKRLDDLLLDPKTGHSWEDVTLHPEDAKLYLGSWGQERFRARSPHGYEKTDPNRLGYLKCGPEDRALFQREWVTRGTVVIGSNYSQKTHTLYLWSKLPVKETRFDMVGRLDRDII